MTPAIRPIDNQVPQYRAPRLGAAALDPGEMLFADALAGHNRPAPEPDAEVPPETAAEPRDEAIAPKPDETRRPDADDRPHGGHRDDRQAPDRSADDGAPDLALASVPMPQAPQEEPARSADVPQEGDAPRRTESPAPGTPAGRPRVAEETRADAAREPVLPKMPVPAEANDPTTRRADPAAADPIRQLRRGVPRLKNGAAPAEAEAPSAETEASERGQDAAAPDRGARVHSAPARAESQERATQHGPWEDTLDVSALRDLRARSTTAEIRGEEMVREQARRGERAVSGGPDASPSQPAPAPADTAASPVRVVQTQAAATPPAAAPTGAAPAGAAPAAGAGATVQSSGIGAVQGSVAARAAATGAANASAHAVPVQRILSQVRMHVRPGVHDLQLRLDPPELGRLRVRLLLEGDALKVTVRASQPEVVQALRNELSSFAGTLRESGIDVTSLDIDLESQGRPGNPADRREHGEEPAGRTRTAEPPGAAVEAAATPAIAGTRRLDVIA